MVLKNPNGFELDLDNADLTVYVDDIELAKINQTYETSMPSQGEFNMPININMDFKVILHINDLDPMRLFYYEERQIKINKLQVFMHICVQDHRH